MSPKEVDSATLKAFRRGTYLTPDMPASPKQTARTAAATQARKMNAMARRGYTAAPSDGAVSVATSAVGRRHEPNPEPSDGAIQSSNDTCSAPPDGAYLDIAISSFGGRAPKSRMSAVLRRCWPVVEQRPQAYAAVRAQMRFDREALWQTAGHLNGEPDKPH